MKRFRLKRDRLHKHTAAMCVGLWEDDISDSPRGPDVSEGSVRSSRWCFEVPASGRAEAPVNVISAQPTQRWAGHPPGDLDLCPFHINTGWNSEA